MNDALLPLARDVTSRFGDDDVALGRFLRKAKAAGHALEPREAEQLIQHARRLPQPAADVREPERPAPPAYDALGGLHAEELLQRKLAPIDAVPTVFPSWSKVCGDEGGRQGLARGWHVTLAARTGVGKSVWALNAARTAVEAGARVYFISLEMSQMQLETRLLAIASGVPVRRLEQGRDFDADAHRRAAEKLEAACENSGGLFLSNRRPLYGLDQVESAARHAVESEGCRLVVVDYLQLAAADPNDPKEITAASHAIRRLATDLGISTIALSQFNRATSAANERPTIYGLFGGSAIENDSDQVLLIDHSRLERVPAPGEGWYGHVLLAKNRHGPTVDIPIHFDARTLRMAERLPDELPARKVG